MDTLENFLKKELGLNTSEADTLGSVRMDLAVMKSMIGSHKKESQITEEDFILEMGECNEPEIRRKIREFYTQFGYPIKDDGILKKDYCDISIKMDKATASVTSTVYRNRTMQITINVW